MKSIKEWFSPTEEQKKQKLITQIEKLVNKTPEENRAGYDLDSKSYEGLKAVYMLELHKSYGYEFVSYKGIDFAKLQEKQKSYSIDKSTEHNANIELEANSTKYYNLWWPKKIIFRVLQLAGLHTTSPNQISMLSVMALLILCYVLTSVPSIFGYGIYPIMMFLTVPLLRHVSLIKWHTLFNNEETHKVEILAPILLGISLTILGVIAKLTSTITIPFIATNIMLIVASIAAIGSIAYMAYAASSNKFDLLFFMAASAILALSLLTIAPIMAISHITLITNIVLISGVFSLCSGLYNLYGENSNKFWTLLCGLVIIAATITLSASLLNASFLFLLAPALTFEMIASSLTAGVLASIVLYGCANEEVKAGLNVTPKELTNQSYADVNFNLEELSFWRMTSHAGKLTGRAFMSLAATAWDMIRNTFSPTNISRVVNSTATTCSSAFKQGYTAVSSCLYSAKSQQKEPGSGPSTTQQ